MGRDREGRPRVLVTGCEVPAGLAALRGAREGGFEPWAAVPDRAAMGAHSRAAAGVICVPDPRLDPEGFVQALAQAVRRHRIDAVLPGTEPALMALEDRDGAFPGAVRIGSAPASNLNHAIDKVALALLSTRAGLDAPPTSVLGAGNGDGRAPRFPAVVKPLRSELAVGGGRLRRFETLRVDGPADLEKALAELPDGCGLVQPFLQGRLVTVNGVAWRGRLVAANHQVAHRIWPRHCGQLAYAQTVARNPVLERGAAHIVGELEWSGVFNLQAIESGGRYYVIDLNPRLYHSLALAIASGLNLPAIWASLLLDLPVRANGYRVGVRFRSEKDDLRAVWSEFRNGGGARALRGLWPRPRTTHAVISWRDPAPALSLLADLRRAVKRTPEAPEARPRRQRTAGPELAEQVLR